jgi:hypothetical protein
MTRKLYLIGLLILVASIPALADQASTSSTLVTEPVADEAADEDLISVEFTSQKSIKCDDKEQPIPSILPLSVSAKPDVIYITSRKSFCTESGYRVDYGVTKYCAGQNFCSRASFESTAPSDTIAKDVFLRMLDSYARKILLDNDITGYLIPAQCFSYCSQARLVWYQTGRMFILGVKNPNDEEAIKSLEEMANSYILEQGD